MLVSAVQWSESAVCIHIFPHFKISFPLMLFTTEHWVGFLVLYNRFSLVIYFIYSSVYRPIPISQFIPTLPSPLVNHKVIFYICDSISALQISSSVPFFQIPHTSDIIWNLFFSFWLAWLCMTHSRSICTSVQRRLYRLTDSQSWEETQESRKANCLIL